MEEFQEVAQREVKYAVARVYGMGEQAGPTLAVLMRPKQENGMILEIQDDGGQVLSETGQAAKHFCSNDTDLYWLQLIFDEESISDYLAQIAMKWLTMEYRERLMALLWP
ncbi:hypothetical protein NDU88_003603 [Pleurodeles waltl]|uniref:Uncharacterized protein n=1 Tax=Pleurodeles waltl TaxID=8319 RepID=A0AAV7SGE5_PLEWA|nr:hypothetical protein NDU88_003603 [Pleurodeles waltl]